MKLQILFCLTVFISLLGCNEGSKQVAQGESSFSEGLDLFEQKEFADAETYFSESLEKGHLNPDLMCEARLKRAKSRIELENYEGAREDLEFLLEGAPNTSEVFATLGKLAMKEGNNDEAKRCFQEAKKQDSQLVIPMELR